MSASAARRRSRRSKLRWASKKEAPPPGVRTARPPSLRFWPRAPWRVPGRAHRVGRLCGNRRLRRAPRRGNPRNSGRLLVSVAIVPLFCTPERPSPPRIVPLLVSALIVPKLDTPPRPLIFPLLVSVLIVPKSITPYSPLIAQLFVSIAIVPLFDTPAPVPAPRIVPLLASLVIVPEFKTAVPP